MAEQQTHIRLGVDVRDRLKALKRGGESYSETLGRVLNDRETAWESSPSGAEPIDSKLASDNAAAAYNDRDMAQFVDETAPDVVKRPGDFPIICSKQNPTAAALICGLHHGHKNPKNHAGQVRNGGPVHWWKEGEIGADRQQESEKVRNG